ncbi:hypothetical protein GEV33_009385 [Tenebrio molitor]|uniref:Uncharacterized protein n=1 Tax=Tenebrio molitor TaxID=7067 RepID=A0A8J6HF08_TENMO|nr:hypothetical protein GEV33_009385 [Tenebrio molitor]
MARQQVVHKNGVRRESVSISVLFLVEMRAKNGARSADEAINTVHAGNCHEPLSPFTRFLRPITLYILVSVPKTGATSLPRFDQPHSANPKPKRLAAARGAPRGACHVGGPETPPAGRRTAPTPPPLQEHLKTYSARTHINTVVKPLSDKSRIAGGGPRRASVLPRWKRTSRRARGTGALAPTSGRRYEEGRVNIRRKCDRGIDIWDEVREFRVGPGANAGAACQQFTRGCLTTG